MKAEHLTGLIAASHTPMFDDGQLNLDVVEAQADHFRSTGVSAAFVGGSTGESQSLTIDERERLAERWINVTRSRDLRVIVQVGHNCQQDARRLSAHARGIGADAVAAHGPSYFKPATVADLVEFCVPIAAASGACPFYFYDIPKLSGVQLPMVEFLIEGKKRMPNLAGLKYTNGDLMQFQECVRLEQGAFDILFGNDEILLAGYILGARGAVGSSYNFAAPLHHRIIDAFERGDYESARESQAKSVRLVRTLQQFGYMASAKSVMGLLGIECGPVRPPLRNLTPAEKTTLQETLESLHLLPLQFDSCAPSDQQSTV